MAMTSGQICDAFPWWKRWAKREELERCVLESRNQLRQDDRSATDFIYALGLLGGWCGVEQKRLETIAHETEDMTAQELAVLRAYHQQMQLHFARAAGALANHLFMDHFHANEMYTYLKRIEQALPFPDKATPVVASRQLQFLARLNELQVETYKQAEELLRWNVKQYADLSRLVRNLF